MATATSWSFPDGVGSKPRHRATEEPSQMPGTFAEEAESIPSPNTQPSSSQESRSPPKTTKRRPRHWPPRTCRICLETVHPTFSTPSESLPEVLQPAPTVNYNSEDPSLGRLLRPCNCKGSSQYVHEGCLSAWRHADPGYGKRNYWQCPTCGYRYKLERMTWGRWISSTATQLTLTAVIFLLALFFMGFIADPVINFYSEPYAVFYAPRSLGERIDLSYNDQPGWAEHFLKGFASLGLLGFVKVIFSLSPWNWFNVRIGGSGRSGTGRDRLSNISWIVVMVGVCTFLWVCLFGVSF